MLKSSKSIITDTEYSGECTAYINVGEAVRDLREKKGISLRAFAAMVGVTPGYVSFVERNVVTSPPTEKLIKKMAHILEADEDELLALAGKVSMELVKVFSKHPRQIAALIKSAKNLPGREIEALTAQAIRRQAVINATTETSDEKKERHGGK